MFMEIQLLKRVDRFQIGIERYGYNSDFRREIEAIMENTPVDIDKLDECLEKYGMPKNK